MLFRFPEWVPLLGGIPLHSFGAFLALSFIVADAVLRREMNRRGMDGEQGWTLVLAAAVGGMVGAKLYYLLGRLPRVIADPTGMIFSATGLTWYGGLILGVLLVWLTLSRLGLDKGKTFDAIALALPLCIAVGRIGCFLAGDDYGRPTASPPGVRFPRGFPPTRVEVLERRYGIEVDPALVARYGDVVPVHPTQLYEVAVSLVVFLIIFRWRDHGQRPGWLFALWLFLYGCQRFLLEIFRLKEDRVFLDTFTVAQLISLVLVAGGAYGLTALRTGGGTPAAKRIGA